MEHIQKKRAVVVCPGRGTYNKPELGYLARYHQDKPELIHCIDANRKAKKQQSISELDSMKSFSMAKHTAGENASSLIYACAAADYSDIDLNQYEIVAVTGNSMGWYIALSVAKALNDENGIELINTMGSMMTDGLIGGQMIYPVIDQNWHIQPERLAYLQRILHQVNQIDAASVYVSIKLGGYYVLAGNDAGLKELENRLERIDDTYPMRLYNHAAFHTPLLDQIASRAETLLPESLFTSPEIPLIDGEGRIWQPYSTDTRLLRRYTLGTQVVDTYDFSAAIEVALKEYAPDKVIVLGPGATLGGAIGQCMISAHFKGINSKQDFIDRQKQDPVLLAMGLPEQRRLVCPS